MYAFFVAPNGHRSHENNSVRELFINRDRVQLVDGSKDEAVYGAHHILWHDREYVILRVDGRCTVRLERDDASIQHGPFDELTFVDGMMLYSLHVETPLARFVHSSKTWIEVATNVAWDRVRIMPA